LLVLSQSFLVCSSQKTILGLFFHNLFLFVLPKKQFLVCSFTNLLFVCSSTKSISFYRKSTNSFCCLFLHNLLLVCKSTCITFSSNMPTTLVYFAIPRIDDLSFLLPIKLS
jgi:hypothetical protein